MKFTEDTIQTIRKYQSSIEALKNRLTDYIAGVRDGMGLSREYKANLKEMRFEEPENDSKTDNDGGEKHG